MKARRYMLSECWKMFETDNKGLQRWLERAKIQPKTSEADHRTKYLTYEQLQQLAAFLDRELPEVLPPPKESTGPYKLLLDQVKEYQGQQLQLQQELANNRSLHNQELGKVLLTLEEVQKEVDNAFSQAHEAWRTIDHAREQFEEELSTLRTSVEGKIEEVRQLYEALAELIKANQQEMEHSQRELSSHVTSLDELFQSRLQGFVETLSRRDDELQALHQRAQKEVSGQFQDVWGTMKKAQDTLTEQQHSLEQFYTQLAAREAEFSQLTHKVASQTKLQASLQQAFQEFQDQQTQLEKRLKEGEERTLALTRELETLESDQIRNLAQLTSQLETTETSQKTLLGTLDQETTYRKALEQQFTAQERLISTIQRELQEERDARQALAHQVSTLVTSQAPSKKTSPKRSRKGREPQMEEQP